MRHWKRLLYYLIINVLVSACTVTSILFVWERYTQRAGVEAQMLALARLNPSITLVSAPGSPQPGLTESPAVTEVVEAEQPVEETPTPEETRAKSYTVQTGDTLGAIAYRFDITVAELMAVNELIDPDRLEVGQVLKLPSLGGEQDAGDTPQPEEATDTPSEELATNTPEPPDETNVPVAGEAAVVIDSVVGAGDLDTERLLLKRTGSGELSLSGWKVEAQGGQVFTFPQLTLFEGGAVNLFTKAGQPTVVDLYWGLSSPVWESGEKAILRDEQGRVQATLAIP
jgi:LysM repeat protein